MLDEGSALWERLNERIAQHFGRVEGRARLRRSLAGLLARMDRKNGWQVAAAIGEDGPQGVQRLLNAAVWDADAVRDELRASVIEHLGDAASGVLIVDESGFPEKGNASCGGASQYRGTIGSTTNCQVGVSLGDASRHGMALLDRAPYLPRTWTNDHPRRDVAGIPKDVRFATKPALAKQLLSRAFAAKAPARWVVADSCSGRAHHFRRWLEEEGKSYIVGILPGQVVEHDGQRRRARALAERLPSEAWVRRSAGEGSRGPRVHDRAVIARSEACPIGMRRRLPARRSPDHPTDLACFRACGPSDTPAEELVRVAGMRWAIEEGFAQAKGEVGLDQYEVRCWDAWHRFVALGLLVHAYLAIVRARARQIPEDHAPKGGAIPSRRSSR